MEGRGKSPAWRRRGERWGDRSGRGPGRAASTFNAPAPAPAGRSPAHQPSGACSCGGGRCAQKPQVRHTQRGQALPAPLLSTPWVSAHPAPAPLWISYCGSLSAWAATGTRTPKDTQSPRSGGPVTCKMSTSCDCLPRTGKHLRGRGCSWKGGREGGRERGRKEGRKKGRRRGRRDTTGFPFEATEMFQQP